MLRRLANTHALQAVGSAVPQEVVVVVSYVVARCDATARTGVVNRARKGAVMDSYWDNLDAAQNATGVHNLVSGATVNELRARLGAAEDLAEQRLRKWDDALSETNKARLERDAAYRVLRAIGGGCDGEHRLGRLEMARIALAALHAADEVKP